MEAILQRDVEVVDGLDVEGACDNPRAWLGRDRVAGDATGAGEGAVAIRAERDVSALGGFGGCVQGGGVGPVTTLGLLATIEDPTRFRRPRDVGVYLGLTPKRYQSGERDVSGGISRQGDAMARHYLYEAANCLLTTWGGRSALNSWGLGLAKRIGAKKARVAVASKLAYLLVRLWRDGAHCREDAMRTA